MRLLAAIPNLRCGGAERVMSILTSHWVASGHEVSLATFHPEESDFFLAPPSVQRFVIGDTGAVGPAWVRANQARVSAFRGAVRESRAEVVVSFLYTMNLLAIAAARSLAPVIVSERTDPRHNPVERWQDWLRRRLYPRADAIVVQTDQVRQEWARRIAGQAPVFTIPNPVLAPDGGDATGGESRQRLIAAVGRLEPGKGFDVLIRAFAKAAADLPEWQLVILGEGEERASLAAQAAACAIPDRVVLAGTGDSAALFRRASAFATASRVEGFPNALLEAMANGLPVVATDCPSGPSDIVRDGVDGFLVPVDDEARLAQALERLLSDERLRRRLGSRASEVADRFSLSKVAARWQEVIDGAVRARAGRQSEADVPVVTASARQ